MNEPDTGAGQQGSAAGAGRERPSSHESAEGSHWLGKRSRPWVIAHRGDSFHAPENTLEAARLAFEAGADAWELDVRVTRDGVPILMHDASLSRTTDVALRFPGDPRGPDFLVADFDYDEIRSLDAGSWFLEPGAGYRTAAFFGTLDSLSAEQSAWYGSGHIRVPTLAEALEFTVQHRWCVNIELKTTSADCAQLHSLILALIQAPEAFGRVLVSSFDHVDLARLARAHSGIAVGVLTAFPLYCAEGYVRDSVGAHAYHPSAGTLGSESDRYRRFPSPDSLRLPELNALKNAGIPVFAYTVNDSRPEGLADHLAFAGVAGLFTDDPKGLAEHWSKRFGAHAT